MAEHEFVEKLEGDLAYVEGLKRELRGAISTGNEDHEKAVLAELNRVAGPTGPETAVAPVEKETR